MKRSGRIARGAAMVCLWTAAHAEGSQPTAEAVWFELRVPGGVASLARALDLGPSTDPERLLFLLARRAYGFPPNTHPPTAERLRRLARLLDVEGGLRARGDAEAVPLPLSPRTWSQAVFRKSIPEDRLFAAIAGDRRAALLACGLAALDDETLRQMEASPSLVSLIADRHAPRFAAFGRSLRLRAGRVETPGGDEAKPLWEAVVGAPAAAPDRFIDALFARDDGRLAYLYDTIASLDPARARFALGLWLSETVRVDRFKALAAGFSDSYGIEWKVDERPFVRFSSDVAWLLTQVSAGPDGTPRGPAWPALWERVFDSRDLPGDPAAAIGAVPSSSAIDAAALVGLVARGSRAERAGRLATFAFGQRAFGDAASVDAPDLLVALRTYRRYPMLASALERIGVRSPGLHADAARHVAALMADLDRAGLALRQFQGALAIVTQASLVRVLDRDAAERLIQSLVALRPDHGRYDGAIASWIRESVLPVLPPGAESAEDAVLSALAGVGSTAPGVGPRTIAWEGRVYRLDLAAAELARLRRVRTRQGGVTLDEALAVSRIAASLAAGIPAARVAPIRAELAAIAEQVRAIGPRVLPRANGWPDAGGILDATLQAFPPPHRSGGGPGARSLVNLGDALLADVLTSLAYAVAFRDPDDRFLLGSNVAHRHDFGLDSPNPDERQHAAWRLPEPQTEPGTPWHVLGSLVNLDVGLSGSALRRLGFDGELQAPVLNSNDRRTFSETVALMRPFDLTDADRDAIGAALRAGRTRVASAGADAGALHTLAAEAGLDAWRRGQLGWLARRAPQRLAAFFTLSELVALGRPPISVPLDLWGSSSVAADGCLCTRFRHAPDWPSITGRADVGLLAARLPDLTIRVAELMSDLGLPTSLTRDVLAVATLEFIEHVQPTDTDDWVTLSRAAAALTREQIEDYASALTADGPLIPESAVEGRIRR